jgi:ligand-binding sensor domain-containing protein/DNA-binding CsgD family transcriptional regulator
MKRTAFLLLNLVLLVDVSFSEGQFPGRFYLFERLVPDIQGTAVTGISSLFQDEEGFLWMGTAKGLVRYDGYRFLLCLPRSGASALPADLSVYPAIEDRRGEIWIGTHGQGLFKFDKDAGSFVQYRHDPQRFDSLSGDIVLAVQEDRDGDLWVGTRLNGLNRLDRERDSFARVRLAPEAQAVLDVLSDRTGMIWVGTMESGLFKIDPGTGDMVSFRHIPGDNRSLGSDTVWTVFEDGEGAVWMGTKKGGLNRYDPESKGFIRFYGAGDFPADLAAQTITAIVDDPSGRLWLGTVSDGLRIWDRKTGEYILCRHDPQDPESLSDDNVTSLFRDASGIIWVGTVRGGLNKCLAGQVKFEHYKHNSSNPRSLSRNDVRALLEDASGRIWSGLDKGVDRIDQTQGVVAHFDFGPAEKAAPNPGAVRAIREDRTGRVWLGTEGDGLARLDPATGTIIHYHSDGRNPNSLSHNRINALWMDRQKPDVIWVGSQRGLNKLEVRTGRWTRFVHDGADPASLSGNIITAIHEDRAGSLWVGTREGLNRLDKATGKCERFVSRLEDPWGSGIKNNIVHCIHEGRDGILWIGTDSGLNRFDRAKGEWRAFAQKEGLSGEVVCGILEDSGGALWVSTNRGLCRLDPETERITKYGIRDGLQSGPFNPGASFKSPDGRMYFGGANGFNVFQPADVRKNPFVPPVVWTAFYRNNQEVTLPCSPSVLRDLTLSYKSGLATFEFAALVFTAPDLNTFAYRLEPRDTEWTTIIPGHQVSLYDVGAGEYTLQVKAANPDGIWNEEGIAITLRVLPPFWRTWWFTLVAAAFILSAVVMAVKAWKKVRSVPLTLEENVDEVIGAAGLTAREQEILRLVLQGSGNKDIANKLFISPSTVRNHISNIYQKLGVNNRLELISLIGRGARKKP